MGMKNTESAQNSEDRFICTLYMATNVDYNPCIGQRIQFPNMGQVFSSRLDAEAYAAQLVHGKSWKQAWISDMRVCLLDSYTAAAYNKGIGGTVLISQILPETALKYAEKRKKMNEVQNLRQQLAKMEADVLAMEG